MIATLRPSLVVAQIALVAAWLGAAIFFSAVVAQAAFAVLPTRALAGALVGKTLPVLGIAGVLVAIILGILGRRGGSWSTPVLISQSVMVFALLGMAFVFTRIDKLRAQMGGPIDALAPTDPLRVAFGRLHGVSVGLLGVAMIAALVFLILSARALGAAVPPTRS